MLVSLVYYTNFYQPPNCFDGVLNGLERGVDCGGECVRVCQADVLPPQVAWVEAFAINPGQYNVTAYIENPNQTEGDSDLEYTFLLYDESDRVVAERSGVVALPPNAVLPVFEGRILTASDVEVVRVEAELTPSGYWLPASFNRNQFRSSNIELSGVDDRPRLNVEISNDELEAVNNVEVVATIFNDAGQAVTASQTYVESIGSRSSVDVVFTWPNPISKTVRSCEVPTDVVMAIDLSGSMNNDGGDPPQPITKALEAAANFVDNLNNESDQIGVVTFASAASLAQELSADKTNVIGKLAELQIDPTEETGFTNTQSALEAGNVELSSLRHNDNARRVLVLLTDGLPTADDRDTEELQAAVAADASMISDGGVEIYTIGLGDNVNKAFIEQVASDPTNAYLAPSAADLSRIYSEISTDLCEVGPTKIEVFAKPVVNFAEVK